METAVKTENKISVGDILVASWGYSMTLTTWVKVIKVSPKTLLVAEIERKALSPDELEKQNLKPGFLQMYTMPLKTLSTYNGEHAPQFRLFANRAGDGGWHGFPDGIITRLYFKKWDGRPQFEDHAD